MFHALWGRDKVIWMYLQVSTVAVREWNHDTAWSNTMHSAGVAMVPSAGEIWWWSRNQIFSVRTYMAELWLTLSVKCTPTFAALKIFVHLSPATTRLLENCKKMLHAVWLLHLWVYLKMQWEQMIMNSQFKVARIQHTKFKNNRTDKQVSFILKSQFHTWSCLKIQLTGSFCHSLVSQSQECREWCLCTV